jgi:nucleoside-diphosphate-sugar epimerase
MSTAPQPASVLVTGADGFIGRHFQRTLLDRGIVYRAAVRADVYQLDPCSCMVGEIGPSTDWSEAIEGVDVVVHLAARAHILREKAVDPIAEFMRINCAGTETLVRAAVSAGVRRFIYVSSVGVLGNITFDAPFTADSPPQPHNAYTRSKLAGEMVARSVAGQRVEVVVLRLPLVYGPGVKANFLRLLRWVDSGWPLPVGAVDNRRSLVNVWNLCDLLVNVLENPIAPARSWLVSDGEDLSTPDLIRRTGNAMRRHIRLLPIPPGVLRLVGKLTRLETQVTQLCGSLVINSAQTCDELGWHPRVSVDDALARTVAWYLSDQTPIPPETTR